MRPRIHTPSKRQPFAYARGSDTAFPMSYFQSTPMLRSPLSLLVGLTYSVMSKASPLPSFSRNEVAKHHTAADLWVIIDGYVYDLTQFQALHPGGAPPLKRVAGKDATVDFYSIHRKNVLNDSRFLKLKVGTVQGFQATQATEPSNANGHTTPSYKCCRLY